MKQMLFFFVFWGWLMAATNAFASVARPLCVSPHFPVHFVILVPGSTAYLFGDNFEEYNNVTFPLYYGIGSIYPKENTFVFTKITNVSIKKLDEQLRTIEKERFYTIRVHREPPILAQVNSDKFGIALAFFADHYCVLLSEVSTGQEIPANVVPRFKRTCLYDSRKDPPTDCAYRREEVEDLFIPFTIEEMEQIAKDHAR